MKNNKWKDLKGYEGIYIINIDTLEIKKIEKTIPEKELTLNSNYNGTQYYALYKKGKRKNISLKKLKTLI